MPTLQTALLSHLHRLMPAEGADADWLARFVANRDEAAFAHLVSRHGPMVWRLCRRLVGDAHLAEDCFQATFLALARQAASIRRPGALAAWLYGVAYRVAAKARAERCRRETLGSEAVTECPDPRPHALDRLTGRELMLVFEMELQRLPESYRLPIVLCCVEGLSLEEAAGRLGWTAGSVKGRLERGRARLHARLLRRGLTLGIGLGTVQAARGLAAGTLAPCLANSTVRAGLAFCARFVDRNLGRGGAPRDGSDTRLGLATANADMDVHARRRFRGARGSSVVPAGGERAARGRQAAGTP